MALGFLGAYLSFLSIRRIVFVVLQLLTLQISSYVPDGLVLCQSEQSVLDNLLTISQSQLCFVVVINCVLFLIGRSEVKKGKREG